MSEVHGARTRDWVDVIRRARLGRTTKSVALMLATYADSDGTRVFPGLARIAVDCELTYNVVQTALAALRSAGLVEMVRQATRRGDSDEYRLILATDLLDRIEVFTPAQVVMTVEQMRVQRRGKVRAQPTAQDAAESAAQPTAPGAQQEAAPHGVCAKPGLHPTASCGCTPRRSPPPTKTWSQEPPPTPTADLDTAVTGSRASPKCAHGLKTAWRSDGQPTCALCRRTPAPDNVIELRRSA